MYDCGICIRCKKWDKQGNLIYEKNSPTDRKIQLIKKLSSRK